MTRNEALAAIALLHAYARGALTAGEPGQPSLEERAWAHSLELDAPGATRADAVEGVRLAASRHPRPTLADVLRYTQQARDARRKEESKRGDASKPALPPPRDDDDCGARAWAVQTLLATRRAELVHADNSEIARWVEDLAARAVARATVRDVANAAAPRLPDPGRGGGPGR